MADVQPEDGFTRIAHPVIEALARASMPGRHLRVALGVARLTWGWNRKADRIGSRQLGELTQIDPSAVRKILGDLLKWGVIIEAGPAIRGRRILGLEKDYERWRIRPTDEAIRRSAAPQVGGRQPTSESRWAGGGPGGRQPTRVGGRGPETVGGRRPDSIERKETLPKKSTMSPPPPCGDAVRLVALLRSEIARTAPSVRIPRKEQLAVWERELDRMLRLDERNPTEVEAQIRWLFGPNLQGEVQFVVQSAKSLRRKFDRVAVQMARRGRDAGGGWTSWGRGGQRGTP
jgi:phage replication O-like protein O